MNRIFRMGCRMDDKNKSPRNGTREYSKYTTQQSRPYATTSQKRTVLITQDRLRTVTTRIDMKMPMWKRVFIENWVYKALALLFTLMLFFIVRQDKTKILPITVNVAITKQYPGVIITNHDQIPKQLKVRIKGRWSDLTKALQKQPFTYPMDLSTFAHDATIKFDMERIKHLIGVQGITVQSISPPSFTITVAPKEVRMVTIIPVLKNKPPKGYKLDKKGIEIKPPKVKIWGIKSEVDKVDKLSTFPIDLSLLNKPAKLDVGIQIPKERAVYLAGKTVRVTVPVVPLQGKRRFKHVNIEVKNCPDGYTCSVLPRFATVYLAGPEPVLMDMDAGRFAHGLVVDATDFDPQQSVYRGISPACERPASISCRIRPRAVTLRFVKQTIQKKKPKKDANE